MQPHKFQVCNGIILLNDSPNVKQSVLSKRLRVFERRVLSIDLNSTTTHCVWSAARFRKSKEETTCPSAGDNLWLSVDTQEELDSLMQSLCTRGLRESKLHRALKAKYDCIVK